MLDFTKGGTGPTSVQWTGADGQTITTTAGLGFVIDLGELYSLVISVLHDYLALQFTIDTDLP